MRSNGKQLLHGRHVVVTGANGELGGAVAALFAEHGAVCHLPVRSPAKSKLAGARIQFAEGVDLLDEGSVGAFYRDLPSLWASVHCAGGFAMKPFADTSLDDLARAMATNATTSFLCAREAVRRMRSARFEGGVAGGRIVNVASRQALEPARGAGMVAYTMSKAAVAAMTRALAEEVAPDGILVNAIAPSTLDTPSNRSAMPTADFTRWVSLEEAAAKILELVSPAATQSGDVVTMYG